MARKKTVSDSSTSTPLADAAPEKAPVSTPAPAPAAPKRLGRKAAPSAAEPVPVVAPAPIASETKAAKRPARKPKAEAPAPVALVAPATPVETSELVPAPLVAPRRLGRKLGASEAAEAPAQAVAPVSSSAPRVDSPAKREAGTTFRKPRPTLAEEAAEELANAPEPVEESVAESTPSFDNALGLSVSFRARSSAPVASTTEAPKRLGRRERTVPEASTEPLAIEGPAIVDEPEIGEFGFAVPLFRPRGQSASQAVSGDTEQAPRFEDEGRDGRRGRRGGRGRDRAEEGEDEGTSEAVDFSGARAADAPPQAVKPPVKPFIDAPEDAPQVIVRPNGPALVHKGRVVTPFVFFADLLESGSGKALDAELRMAAESGLRLHAFPAPFSGTADTVEETADAILAGIERLLAIDKEAMALIRLDLSAPRGWDGRFADAAYRGRDGKLAAPSIADDSYWEEVRTSLQSLTTRLAASSVAGSILGLQVDRDAWEIRGGYDGSEAANTGFRRWLRSRYLNDVVMLRAAWFNGAVDFDTAEAPNRAAPRKNGEGLRLIRTDRRLRRYVDYHLYLSDITVTRIADLAYAVKEASGGRMLFGARYGDTFENVSPERGQLSLGKLLRTPEIDFVSGPPSEDERGPGGTASVRAPIDSITLNGKLYLAELDYRTSLGHGGEDEEGATIIRSPQALENVHTRDLGFALAHGSGTIWMDRHGRGALNTPSAWKRAESVRRALDLRLASEEEAPDVAVFIDERALAYLDDAEAFGNLVRDTRDSVLRAGVSAGFYLLSDLAHRERFPESKVYIFLNAWDVRAELRSAIKTRLQKDDKVLCWLYAAGLFDGGREALERVREVTGIALRPQPFASKAGTQIINRRDRVAAAFPDGFVEGPTELEPTYSAIPEDSQVLGEYAGTGLPSFVVRRLKGEERGQEWTSVFLGEPAMNPELVRALAGLAGAHVWGFGDDVIHVRTPFLTVHASSAGAKAVAMPQRWSASNAVTGAWSSLEGSSLKFDLVEGATASYFVGPRESVQRMLDTDLDAALKVTSIPPREINVRQDVSSFEVPIVKLDEWSLEATDADGIADEWFLRPQSDVESVSNIAVPVTAESEDDTTRTGRQRRRRRDGGGGRNRPEDDFASPPLGRTSDGEDVGGLGMSVVFRKRS